MEAGEQIESELDEKKEEVAMLERGLQLARRDRERTIQLEAENVALREEVAMLEEGMRQLAKKVTVAELEDQHDF
eukprot:SAG31_NODE_4092_length_3600_cov_3.905109_4_plen_75_part_00